MIKDWKKGDILILEKKEEKFDYEYGKTFKIGDKFILSNDYNTYENIFYIGRNGYKFSITKKEIEECFSNLREKRNDKIDKLMN